MQAIAPDSWDHWNDERDRYLESARSPKYVSPDVAGAEDLDQYGQWTQDPNYGNVWAPNVGPGWAPYQDGRWVWEDYYGWTWVSYDPWGWAPYHYGRWFYGSGALVLVSGIGLFALLLVARAGQLLRLGQWIRRRGWFRIRGSRLGSAGSLRTVPSLVGPRLLWRLPPWWLRAAAHREQRQYL